LLFSFQVIYISNYFASYSVEDTLKTQEKCKEPEKQESEPETTAEVLFLCSYEGCGKTFLDAGALRKHALNHGGRQYICHYDGCGKVACIDPLILH